MGGVVWSILPRDVGHGTPIRKCSASRNCLLLQPTQTFDLSSTPRRFVSFAWVIKTSCLLEYLHLVSQTLAPANAFARGRVPPRIWCKAVDFGNFMLRLAMPQGYDGICLLG